METPREPERETQESEKELQDDDETLIVPPPTFRDRLRAAQRLREIQPRTSSANQASAEDAKQSSKRR
jgi:hypothetical protein